MRYAGKITTWKDDKGFGFITTNGTSDKIFVHIRSFSNRTRRPIEGDKITYEIKRDAQQRPEAIAIRFANEKIKKKAPEQSASYFSSFIAGSFCLILLTLAAIGKVPQSILLAYLILGIITYLVYKADKTAAQNNAWRTPESTLHFLSLIGGWLGALLAQRRLRHKSKKSEFQGVFWATVIINCCAFGWILTKGDFRFVKNVIGF